jgi:hypothetical protein
MRSGAGLECRDTSAPGARRKSKRAFGLTLGRPYQGNNVKKIEEK